MPVLANIIGPELLIVLAIGLLLFGSSRLPHLARSLGSAKGEFERGLHGDASAEDAAESAALQHDGLQNDGLQNDGAAH